MRKNDLTGQRFGLLVVEREIEKRSKDGQVQWRCRCGCGKLTVCRAGSLRSGNTKSCGCTSRQLVIGEVFGYLTIVEKQESDSHGHSGWLCRCECGNEVIVRGYNLVTNNTKSCGCKRLRDRKQHALWSGHGDITGVIWRSYKRGATDRDLPFEISIEFGWDLYLKQNRCCALSGLDICFAASNAKHSHGETTASLDRIDSDLGYTEDNVQWVHKDINKMKWDMPEERFLDFCEAITRHRRNVA